MFLGFLVLLLVMDYLYGISKASYVLLVLVYISILFYGVFDLSFQFFLPVKWKGSNSGNTIAITFDDGPLPEKTERILEILEQRKIPAAFFCIGHRIQQFPEILKRVVEQGHLVGNHTFTHTPAFNLKSAGDMKAELTDTDSEIEKVIGQKPRFFRPPYGVTNPNLASAIAACGHVTVGWSVRSLDSVLEAERVFNRVKGVKAGDIVLFHDYSEASFSILPRFLDHVNNLGLKIVRVDELINERAYV